MIPTRLFNPNYSWEINKKWEGSIDLGFAKENILFSATYYQNRSSNQLVNYTLPGQTGFSSIIQNLPAVVQNKGFEFTLYTRNISGKNFSWTTSVNLSIPQNKLISFPGLSTSTYANVYVEGKSLNLVNGYHLIGVNTTTGIYEFQDLNKDGLLNPDDYVALYDLDPKFYGGMNNSFEYKGWKLNIFLEFKQQTGLSYNNYPIYNFTPGMMNNLPTEMLDHWQKPGDKATLQQFTQTYTPAFDAQYNFSLSDGRLTDASYVRIKNVSLSYSFPEQLNKKLHLSSSSIYLLGQNLYMFTNYKGSDPETQSLFILSPLRMMTLGVQLIF